MSVTFSTDECPRVMGTQNTASAGLHVSSLVSFVLLLVPIFVYVYPAPSRFLVPPQRCSAQHPGTSRSIVSLHTNSTVLHLNKPDASVLTKCWRVMTWGIVNSNFWHLLWSAVTSDVRKQSEVSAHRWPQGKVNSFASPAELSVNRRVCFPCQHNFVR